ncbi:MAG: O-antigen ligase family protein [Clostridia bacterium]|nr:O-antigen ligase family protein [Clostridia bacterium]
MIRIQEQKINDLLSYLAVFVAFFCATNGELLYTKNTVVYYLPFLLCFAALALELIAKGKFKLTSYVVWRIILIAFFFLAYVYAVNEAAAFITIKKLLLQSVVVFLIDLKCTEDPNNIRQFIKLAAFAMFVNLVYLAKTVDMTALEEGERLGVSSVNEAWNANQIGLMASLGAVMIFYVFFINAQNHKKLGKVFGVVLVAFFLIFVVLSGSKKSLIIIFVTLMVYLLGSSKSHKIRNIVIAIICAYGILYALYNVPFLYEHLGYRFEELADTVGGTGGDRSSRIRQHMIEVGLEAFSQKPIFGYGLNGFSQVYGSISGTSVYSHNNYVELLVNTGIVGFLLYYGYVAGILFKKSVANKESALFKAVLVALLVADVGMVSYADPFCQYVLCIAICAIFKKPSSVPEREALQKNNATKEISLCRSKGSLK